MAAMFGIQNYHFQDTKTEEMPENTIEITINEFRLALEPG